MLANGADVNERTGGGQTPLILATIFGHTHLIPLLLDAGADPQLRDNLGLNAIDWAQRRGATEAIDVLSNKPVRTARSATTTRAQTPPPRSPDPDVETSRTVSDEERSRRWIAGLKQRIAEQSQREVPDGPNIFRPHVPFPLESLPLFSSSSSEPQPEIPAEPSPQPELPATSPEPQPEIPAPSPDPQHDIPAEPTQPEPESPAEPAEPQVEARAPQVTQERRVDAVAPQVATESQVEAVAQATSQPQVEAVASQAEPEPQRSMRKRCPKCNAVYNSDLVAYCAHHFVALVEDDVAPPIITPPQTTSPVLFWMIIIITLTGSVMVGSVVAAFFYSSKQVQPAITSSPPVTAGVQKGTPVVGKELEGKVVSLPIAECPLNGQEAIPGTVIVRVSVSKTGQVTEAKASGGDWLLRGAASEAAMKSTFAPEKLRGHATEGTITYTFEP